MQVPFLSFRKMHGEVKNDVMNAFENVYDSHWYILGGNLTNFERNYAAFNTTNFCAGVANGLDAIILSLKALGIKPGDEVIVPSNTYIATWLAVSYLGAIPVPVEPDSKSYNIDPHKIVAAITPLTKAIIPVHLYGQICDMKTIMAIATKYNLWVVEDNAQAQGTTCFGQLSGSFGHINATSFYPGKNVGALGDAGAVTTNSEELYRKVFVLRNYGSQKKYYNEVMGINSRLDEVQAAILNVKLPHIKRWNEERVAIATNYNNQLQQIEHLILPQIASGCTSNYHLYVVRTNQRDMLQTHLAAKGIGTLIHYPVPPHLQDAYSELGYKKGDFPIAEEIADTCLSLPIYPGLTDAEINYICQSVREFFIQY